MTKLQGTSILLHGPPKIGKTTLASKFPGPILLIATEPGYRFLAEDIRKNVVKLQDKDDWSKFLAVPKRLEEAKTKPKTVVVDTVGGLYNLGMEAICAASGWAHPSDGPHGKGWNAVRTEIAKAMSKLAWVCERYNITLILIDHTKIEEVETATNKYQKLTCSMPGQARQIFPPAVDHIWFLGYHGNQGTDAMVNFDENRALWIRGTEVIEAGCRDPNVKTSIIHKLRKDDPYTQIVKALENRDVDE